jgi:hypothetical protein
MGILQLELAYDALDRFEPRVLNCDDDNYVDWQNDTKELIRLAAEFGTAFGEVDKTNEMSRREKHLADISGNGSAYDTARRGVIPIIKRIASCPLKMPDLQSPSPAPIAGHRE